MKREVPRTSSELVERLRELRDLRERRKNEHKRAQQRRRTLSSADREHVLKKTNARCHICGGEIIGRWQADHVLAHSVGGEHSTDNYLPAHELCNNYRWDYLAEEFRLILKLGVWSRTQIEKETNTGREIAERFLTYERARERRRKVIEGSATV